MKCTGDDGSTASGQLPALERSLTQRLEALERANDIRTRRARLKRELKAGGMSIHMLLREPPDFILTAKVFDILLAVPKYGRVKVDKVLAQCRISPSKTVGGLSERQRDELLRLLRSCSREQQQPACAAAPSDATSVPAGAAAAQPETARATRSSYSASGGCSRAHVRWGVVPGAPPATPAPSSTRAPPDRTRRHCRRR